VKCIKINAFVSSQNLWEQIGRVSLISGRNPAGNQRFAADLLPKVLGANKRIDFERFYGRNVNVSVAELHEFPD